jgi:hypothetical protein
MFAGRLPDLGRRDDDNGCLNTKHMILLNEQPGPDRPDRVRVWAGSRHSGEGQVRRSFLTPYDWGRILASPISPQ